MVHYKLRNVQQFGGGFTDLFIIGTARVKPALGATEFTSDFTASGTTQSIVLDALAARDVVISNALLDVNTAAVHAGTITVSVGRVGAVAELIAAKDVKTAAATFADDAGESVIATVAVNLVAAVTVGSGNVSDITAGDIMIWTTISRLQERVTDRSV